VDTRNRIYYCLLYIIFGLTIVILSFPVFASDEDCTKWSTAYCQSDPSFIQQRNDYQAAGFTISYIGTTQNANGQCNKTDYDILECRERPKTPCYAVAQLENVTQPYCTNANTTVKMCQGIYRCQPKPKTGCEALKGQSGYGATSQKLKSLMCFSGCEVEVECVGQCPQECDGDSCSGVSYYGTHTGKECEEDEEEEVSFPRNFVSRAGMR
jgi:hypothetical protein